MEQETYRRALGAAIRGHRESRGLSQVQLASQVQLTQASVSNYEAGKRDIGAWHLVRLDTAFGLAAGTLLAEAAPREEVA